MDTACIVTSEEIMDANYRGLQHLAKRVGIRANTREDVLRRSLLRVSVPEATLLQSSVECSPEGHFQSAWPTELPLHAIFVVFIIAALACVFWFPNCLSILFSHLVLLAKWCVATAAVCAAIFFCKRQCCFS